MKREWDKFDKAAEREGKANGVASHSSNRIRQSEDYNRDKFDKLFVKS